MVNEFSEFLPDIQSINPEKVPGFVLFCDSNKRATEIQQQLRREFNIPAIIDVDAYNAFYIIPLNPVDDKLMTKCIKLGLDWDKSQTFIKHTITLYSDKYSNQIYNVLVARGYNVTRLPNNMQFIVKCLDNSGHNDEMQNLNNELTNLQASNHMSMEVYFNKVLFNGKIENIAYRMANKQEFTLDEIEKEKDLIIRGMLYQYFNKRIRAHLHKITFPHKFDANKLKNKEKQNINLVRDFLYDTADKYIRMQSINAANTKHNVVIKFDYLKSCNDYKDFKATLTKAKQWHRDEIALQKNITKYRRESERGVYKIMDLNDGFYVVQLFTTAALDYEGQMLDHCAGDGYYDTQVHLDSVQIYSIRDERGYPYLTIEVNNGKVTQCYGYHNRTPNDPKLRTAVRTLMHTENLDVDTWNPLIAYTKQNGILYDIFDLPKNFVLNHSLDLCGMEMEALPDMSTVTIDSDFLCASNKLPDLTSAPYIVKYEVKCSGNPLKSLRGMPRKIGGKIYLSNTQLTPKSYVPLYMESKLGDIVGIDEHIIAAWREQIAKRKSQIASIVAALNNYKR